MIIQTNTQDVGGGDKKAPGHHRKRLYTVKGWR